MNHLSVHHRILHGARAFRRGRRPGGDAGAGGPASGGVLGQHAAVRAVRGDGAVSTGVAYTVLQPIVERLKNPVTALLILAVVAGSGFLVSQVFNAMVGDSDFIYTYDP
ncbi:hypothetical protein ABZP36_002123 [Zizania latifolia]